MSEKHPILFAYSWLAGFSLLFASSFEAETFLNVVVAALLGFIIVAIIDDMASA